MSRGRWTVGEARVLSRMQERYKLVGLDVVDH